MEVRQAPIAQAQMLIRSPARQVFEAFVDPAVTTRFWFSKSSGRLEAGKQVRWDWEMYGVSAEVHVKEVSPNERIAIEWDDGNRVVWIFTPRANDETFVSVTESGFSGDADKVVARALDSQGGFNLVLAGLKVFLEHGIEPNLVADHNPDAIVTRQANGGMAKPITDPDLSDRPYNLTVERWMKARPQALYKAWTAQFDRWFAAPGTVLMEPRVDSVFFFETVFKPETASEAQRHPHYGRFLRLEPDRLVELSWVTGAGGTEGAETVVTVRLTPKGEGTDLKLTHAGFASAEARDRTEHAWPSVLEQLDAHL